MHVHYHLRMNEKRNSTAVLFHGSMVLLVVDKVFLLIVQQME